MSLKVLKSLCRQEKLKEGLQVLKSVSTSKKNRADHHYLACASLLQACTDVNALHVAFQIYSHITKYGIHPSIVLCTILQRSFKGMPDADHHSLKHNCTWKAVVQAYIEGGFLEEGYKLYVDIVEEGLEPEEVIFLSLLRACLVHKKFELAKDISKYMLRSDIQIHVYVGNVLLKILLESKHLEIAVQVFDAMVEHDVISWTTMITGQAKLGYSDIALRYFRQMQQETMQQDAMSFVGVISACAKVRYLAEGRMFHACVHSMGLLFNTYVANSIIDLYARACSADEAWLVFEEMQDRDVISWNTLIGAKTNCGEYEEALTLFWQMCWDGINWSRVTFLTIFNAVANIGNLNLGKQIHAIMLAINFSSTVYLENVLVHMYTTCGSINNAENIFKKIKYPDVAVCTAMIIGYLKVSSSDNALNVFWNMIKQGVKPNEITYVNVISSCTTFEQLEKVHKHILDQGILPNVFMNNALINIYTRFGKLAVARKIFDAMPDRNVVSWTSMISGCAKQGQLDDAFRLFGLMEQDDAQPNEVSCRCILKVCGLMESLEKGRCIHHYMIHCDIKLDVVTLNSLVEMYSKCGSMEDAYDAMPKEDLIKWAQDTLGT